MTDLEQRVSELETTVARLEALLEYHQPAMREAQKLVPYRIPATPPDRVGIPSTCLQEQIESAKKSIEEWPERMKRSKEQQFKRRNDND